MKAPPPSPWSYVRVEDLPPKAAILGALTDPSMNESDLEQVQALEEAKRKGTVPVRPAPAKRSPWQLPMDLDMKDPASVQELIKSYR